ncbi:reverse transcriptase domain-containing protein [Filibacter tadaridae]|uniref:Group II intron-encoded protein LtrA n=1 Tax=Filibacter tadaridae TaxID=2483811 RepID=A0A3P5WQN8_9BACL|nr:reverse transcriptase domain-containing protein [Filibacter tadaridae]VDC24028.1 Group II intron-encoded protein LtrA [Filibacter tadaridae]
MYSDQDFKNMVTREKVKDTFELYLAQKTDILTEEPTIEVREGLDGIGYQLFQKTLSHQIDTIYKRIQRSNYFFYPLKEVEISKDPLLTIVEAKKQGKTRTLSIAIIRDIITQKLLYDFINPIAEKQFSELSYISFAYRKNVNAQKAAQKVFHDIKDGYIYALDADLKGFFDNIPHEQLFEQVKAFFPNMPGIQKLLYRFIHVDIGVIKKREPKRKLIRVKRKKGIPQGGIISGLLANIYLHQFDLWVIKNLGSHFDLRYTRYADDFVIVAKNKEDIITIKEECNNFLEDISLILHPDPQKTKISTITKDKGLDFVGFKISQNHIGIKEDNIKKFKYRIEKILKSTDFSKQKSLELLKLRCSYKFFGNDLKKFKCQTCGEFEQARNWMKFFLVVTDTKQLKQLDSWIYKSINYYYFKNIGIRLNKNALKEIEFPSLELLYYTYRKQLNKNTSYCVCNAIDKSIVPTRNPYEELFSSYS